MAMNVGVSWLKTQANIMQEVQQNKFLCLEEATVQRQFSGKVLHAY